MLLLKKFLITGKVILHIKYLCSVKSLWRKILRPYGVLWNMGHFIIRRVCCNKKQ